MKLSSGVRGQRACVCARVGDARGVLVASCPMPCFCVRRRGAKMHKRGVHLRGVHLRGKASEVRGMRGGGEVGCVVVVVGEENT